MENCKKIEKKDKCLMYGSIRREYSPLILQRAIGRGGNVRSRRTYRPTDHSDHSGVACCVFYCLVVVASQFTR